MKLLLLLVASIAYTHAQPVNVDQLEQTQEVSDMMLRYGWAKKSFVQDSETFKQDLRSFQKFLGVPETGVVDGPTLTNMKRPRCGDRDVPEEGKRRVRRYNHQGTRWGTYLQLRLRWQLMNEGRTLNRTVVRSVMRRAFKLWSDKTNLKFTETFNDTDPEIKVSFQRYSHGDGYPFDGNNGVLAHAFYPLNNEGLSGDVHFDDDENLSADRTPNKDERDLMWIAVHEIGHSIGLEHSREQDAIMYPYYTGYKPNIQLKYDDIIGIQTLYGGKDHSRTAPPLYTTKKSTTPAPTTPKAIPKTNCKDLRHDCDKNKPNCFKKESDWDNWMKSNCELTCGWCVKVTTTKPLPTTAPPSVAPPSCRDEGDGRDASFCYNNKKYCQTVGGGWKDYMQSHCAKTCAFCT